MDVQRSRAQAEPIVILGGGLSGLAASAASGAPVYEGEDEVGGIAGSDGREGFTFDRGIHVLQGGSPRALKLLEEGGLRLVTRSRQAYIYSHGVYTAYPFQVNTAGMPLPVRMRCVWDFLTRNRNARPTNYEEWMHANVGRGFAERFLIPYSEKFWTVHPREMTYEWTGNRVPHPTTLQVLRGAFWSRQTRIGTNASFRYPASSPGYAAVGLALATRAGPIHRRHRACRLDVHGRTVHFENGAEVSYRHLISTIPLPDLVAICPDAPPEVRAAAARLRANSIMVVNLGIGRPGVSGWHWVHFPEREVSFFRISFPHNFADNVAPPGTSSISAEVAYSAERPVRPADIVERVVDDLVKVGLLRREDPVVFRATRDIRYAYCIHDFERKASVRIVRDWMIAHDVVPTGRYGLWNYFWSHEAINSGLLAGDRARKAIAGHEDAIEEECVAAE